MTVAHRFRTLVKVKPEAKMNSRPTICWKSIASLDATWVGWWHESPGGISPENTEGSAGRFGMNAQKIDVIG